MALQRVRDGFIVKDENNLLNIEPDDEVHNAGDQQTFSKLPMGYFMR